MAEQIAVDQAPMVLGLHGDWGSGKTSALRAMQYHLSGENHRAEKMPDDDIAKGEYQGHVVTVWFEAWRYQNEAAPVVALQKLWLATRNLKNIDLTVATCLNIKQLLNTNHIVLSNSSLELINSTYGKQYA